MSSPLAGPPKAVLFDAGGVLVTPPFAQHHAIVGGDMSLEEVRRSFYAAYGKASTPTEDKTLVDFWDNYSRHLGLVENPFHHNDALLRWNQPTEDAIDVVNQLCGAGLAIAVVSNGAGIAADLLREAGISPCEGKPTVDLILDSGDTARYPDERHSRKPNPTMIHDAIAHLGVEPHEVLFVGDSLWSDALAALRAEVPFLHLDPFDDCTDVTFDGVTLRTNDHAHVGAIQEVLPYALGKQPRTLIHHATSTSGSNT